MTSKVSGLHFYDSEGKDLLQTNRFLDGRKWMSVIKFDLSEDERLLGVRYGRRAQHYQRLFDL
jgi:hypothetical protein